MKILEMFSLKDRVALVTGGAGLYGRQIVESLAEAGARTIMASRDLSKLQKTADDFAQKGLKNIQAKSLDQSDESSILRLRDEILKEYGRVDVLVNNAVLRSAKVDTYDPKGWQLSMLTNVVGLYMMTELFSQPMISQKKGSIINVGSMQGMIGIDPTLYEGLNMGSKMPDYFFHKGGMINYTRYMGSVLGRHNVRVNCISPGGFFNNQPEAFVKRYNDRTFLGRMAGEQDLKGIIVFLASDASEYITGTNIPVDGGYTAK
jgi:NAD(P)-dependent dehydrogenase (short-subunit alcohol dehydrogenase family)